MNLLNFIDKTDLETMDTPFINLHTRNKDKAVNQCKNFFASHLHFANVYKTTDRWSFFTSSNQYSCYAGYQYDLKQSKGVWWLVRNNDEKY